ncbi:MAG: hypothetical protein P8R42_14390 [Candidatus Binatia bacterium]|nr:hypothetical protein [Candidatus Binatia bacterium]
MNENLPEIGLVVGPLLAGCPIGEQMRIQANAERLGAATWRALASSADEAFRGIFASCAPLEEESAAPPEALISEGV